MLMRILLTVLVILLFVLLALSFHIVPQNYEGLVETLEWIKIDYNCRKIEDKVGIEGLLASC